MMQQLGISIYPEKTSLEDNFKYLELANKYHYTRIFTSLLELTGGKDQVIDKFSQIIAYANQLGFKTIIDINPRLFKQLNASYNDLSFFKKLGVWGIRLDTGFSGMEEAMMTRNEYGLKIEINISSGTHYLDNIMAFSPKKDNLLGCHNFYPQKYRGLEPAFFIAQSKKFKNYSLHTAAFISSATAKNGPWPVQDGLPTMEIDRSLPIATQVNHLVLTGLIDDIIIGNAFASEEELAAVSRAFFANYPQIGIDTQNLSVTEKKALFDNTHLYRGDQSEYLLRDSITRVVYKDVKIEPHDNQGMIKRGDILIVNKNYGQYNAETQIALKDFPNDGRRNKVGHLKESDEFLLSMIKPWSRFLLVP